MNRRLPAEIARRAGRGKRCAPPFCLGPMHSDGANEDDGDHREGARCHDCKDDEKPTRHGDVFSTVRSNDIEFSGERKRVRCNEGLGNRFPPEHEERQWAKKNK